MARRVTYFIDTRTKVVTLTTFRKQRQNERQEVARARHAMAFEAFDGGWELPPHPIWPAPGSSRFGHVASETFTTAGSEDNLARLSALAATAEPPQRAMAPGSAGCADAGMGAGRGAP